MALKRKKKPKAEPEPEPEEGATEATEATDGVEAAEKAKEKPATHYPSQGRARSELAPELVEARLQAEEEAELTDAAPPDEATMREERIVDLEAQVAELANENRTLKDAAEARTREAADAELVDRLDALSYQLQEREAEIKRLIPQTKITRNAFERAMREHPEWLPADTPKETVIGYMRRMVEAIDELELALQRLERGPMATFDRIRIDLKTGGP